MVSPHQALGSVWDLHNSQHTALLSQRSPPRLLSSSVVNPMGSFVGPRLLPPPSPLWCQEMQCHRA